MTDVEPPPSQSVGMETSHNGMTGNNKNNTEEGEPVITAAGAAAAHEQQDGDHRGDGGDDDGAGAEGGGGDDDGGEDDDGGATSQLLANTPAGTAIAVMRGQLSATGSWSGIWANSLEELSKPSFTNKFWYKATGEGLEDKEQNRKPLQHADCWLRGHFFLNKSRIIDTCLCRFYSLPDSDTEFRVEMYGRNKYGKHRMEGTYNAVSLSLQMTKFYMTGNFPPDIEELFSTHKRQRSQKLASASSFSQPAAVAQSVKSRVRKPTYNLDPADADANRRNTTSIAAMVRKLMNMDTDSVFLNPVPLDTLPGYADQIAIPMDLGSIKSRLDEGIYTSEDHVIRDVRLTFENCMKYWHKTHVYHILAKDMLSSFERDLNLARAAPPSQQTDAVAPPVVPIQGATSSTTSGRGGGIGGRRKSLGSRMGSGRSAGGGRKYGDDDDEDDGEEGYDDDKDESFVGPPIKRTRGGFRGGMASPRGITTRSPRVAANHPFPYATQGGVAAEGDTTEEMALLRQQMDLIHQQIETLKQMQRLSSTTNVGAVPTSAPPSDVPSSSAAAAATTTTPATAMDGTDDTATIPPPSRKTFMPRPPKPQPPPKRTHVAGSGQSPITSATTTPEVAATSASAGAATSSSSAAAASLANTRPLSYQEKRQLSLDIKKLPADRVQRVIEIIAEGGGNMAGDDEEVEIDLEKLPLLTLRNLQKYVRDVLREKKKAPGGGGGSTAF